MEQMIVFIYDTSYCQTEEDDPQKAVLFFHPSWVSDQQRLALCGQLMGAAHFCSSVFSTSTILTLQSGKFVLKKFGQYVLSVGSDQTLPDWILSQRFNILQGLLEFYHKSFDALFVSASSKYDLFVKKLHEVFELFSPIIQYTVSTFGHTPTVKFPKQKSTMFLEAFQLLESCCSFEGVLGGTILHNSRVIATLLDSNITKILALTDPFRIKSEAEKIATPFHLPLGVQLLKVFLRHNTYDLAKDCAIAKTFFSGASKKQNNGPEGKQDLTKIFTVLEEDDELVSCVNRDNAKEKKLRQKTRKYCKSRLENTLKERSKSFVANYNIKICSTPTVEKKIVHEDLLSICNNPKVDPKPVQQPAKELTAVKPNKCAPSKYINNQLYRISMDDLMIDFSYKNYPVPLRYYSFGLPKICKELEQATKEDRKKGNLLKNRFYKTIADPSNPVFRFDGFPVSKSLYNHCLNEHYKDFITANITIDSREEFIRKKNLENEFQKTKTGASAENSNDSEISSQMRNKEKLPEEEKVVKEVSSANQKLFRRPLSLPLKPMSSFMNSENSVPMSVVKNTVLNPRTPTTPLMTKLSLLALEEQHDWKNYQMSVHQTQSRSKPTTQKKTSVTDKRENHEIVSCCLFVCGHRNFTLLLLLDENVQQNPDLILSLWEICNATLEKVEFIRNKSIDHLTNNGVGSSYSFLSLDPQWGTVQKSGAWGNDDMKLVSVLHQDLIQAQNITEIIVRNEDTVIYGYRCGNTETFYQQGGCSTVGLPTPADLLGVVPLKARRRLERDHGVILL